MSNMYTVCEDDAFKINIEEEQGHLFIHCVVHKHSKSTIKAIKDCFKTIKEELFTNGFDWLYCYTQNLRFAQAIDNSLQVKSSVSSEGQDYTVVQWELEGEGS